MIFCVRFLCFSVDGLTGKSKLLGGPGTGKNFFSTVSPKTKFGSMLHCVTGSIFNSLDSFSGFKDLVIL
jgi:hypothetical protein